MKINYTVVRGGLNHPKLIHWDVLECTWVISHKFNHPKLMSNFTTGLVGKYTSIFL